ncbi:ATP-dependent DNA ligase [gamma proteobacterium IMCC2047]|nr:ATP-dependent DNA ligase [gamma proteobacterium IMCC2047]
MLSMFNTLSISFVLVFCATLLADEKSAIMQAKKYATDIVVADYFVSEKLDGVRARWDGKQLLSRNGKVFAAPAWFSAGFPNVVLDGELWLGRGQYQQTVSVVSRQQPHRGWRDVRYMLFDLPKNKQPFFGRYSEMQRLVEQSASVYLGVIEQQRITSHDQLMAWLDAVVGAGGEGLMLHHKDSFYMNGRSTHLLKLKKFDDAEAVVVGYKNGKGKYTGMVGSLKLRMDNGKVFYVGSGLTDDLRANPPPLGSMVTFRHQGFTDSGLPRFPVYLRQRLVK